VSTRPAEFPRSRWLALLEIALVFGVFFLQGATPVPEVNEPYYLGKAIHYWNPDWVRGDFFLESADSHEVFYFTFGWLSLVMSPEVLAWSGRLLTWWLLAWSWRRMCFATVPRRWFSVLAAALFVGLLERCQMAGEWVIGGVEAKGFAYVLVFLGLEALAASRWNRMWLLFGAASAFHVLVGGWSVVAGGLAWVALGKDRPRLLSMAPALVGGFLLSLPGLVPVLLLDRGADAEVIRQAHQIYVFQRLYHHLWIADFPPEFIRRFIVTVLAWVALISIAPAAEPLRRLRAFVVGALVIAAVGAALSLLVLVDPALCARLARFYWYRLSDVMAPLGIAIEVTAFLGTRLGAYPAWRPGWVSVRVLLGVAVLLAALHVGGHAVACAYSGIYGTPPLGYRLSDEQSPQHVGYYVTWRRACDWIAESGEIPADARFITPRMTQTFKWYARRAEVANWKEIPQDARAIVDWWRRMNDLYATDSEDPWQAWYISLSDRPAWELKNLGRKYGADYVITYARPPLALEPVYTNQGFAVYRLKDDE
jgi:hypothetical protein